MLSMRPKQSDRIIPQLRKLLDGRVVDTMIGGVIMVVRSKYSKELRNTGYYGPSI
jgi:hypothetical protein